MKNFFSHDEGARNDPKLIKVLMRLGQAGKGVYWDLIEMLYEQEGYLLLSECESYAFALRTDCALIQSLVNDFGLFVSDGEKFWSESALRRLDLRRSKSQKAAESAQKRWGNANVMRTHNEGNAIKGKENKVKETKEKKEERENTGEVVEEIESTPLETEKEKKETPGGAATIEIVHEVEPVIPSVPSPTKSDPFYRNRNAESVNVPFSTWFAAYQYRAKEEFSKPIWVSLTDDERLQAMIHTPQYVAAQPEKRWRKTPENYLSEKIFNDEIVPRHATNANTPKNAINGHINGQSNPFGQGAIIPPGASYRPQTFGRRNKSGVGDTESAGAGSI